MYEKMEAELDKISKREKMDRKDAMIAMNDLKKKLEERRQQLGSSEQMLSLIHISEPTRRNQSSRMPSSA